MAELIYLPYLSACGRPKSRLLRRRKCWAFGRHWWGTVAMGQASKYPSLLATPIDLRKLPLEGDLFELVLEELSTRIVALTKYYQIDPMLPVDQIYRMLACRLAFHHVPGLRISNPQRKRGAKPKW